MSRNVSVTPASIDELEGELRQRALIGTEKPVFYADKACGTIRSYNDNLGMFLLKNRRHDVFGEYGRCNERRGRYNTLLAR